jgi:CRISPR-associated protein Cas1
MNDCRSALETVGLDPQLGLLHAVRPGRAALALDLMKQL